MEFARKQTIADLQTGDHLCCLFSSDEEYMAVTAELVRDGIRRNERVFCSLPDTIITETTTHLIESGIDVEALEQRGQLTMLNAEGYYQNCHDDIVGAVTKDIRQAFLLAKENNYATLRLIGDGACLAEGLMTHAQFWSYEAQVNKILPECGIIAACLFDRRTFSPDLMLKAFATHPLIYNNGEIYSNLYYIDSGCDSLATPNKTLDLWIRNIAGNADRQQKLADREQRYRAIFENAADAVFVHDMKGRILDVNQRACSSLGYTRNKLLKMSVQDIDAEMIPQKQFAFGNFYPVVGEPVTLQRKHRSKDGREFPVEIRSVSYYASTGKPVIMSLARDVSERKAAEQAVRESESRFRHIYENAPVMMHSIDLQGRICNMNSKWLQELGYSREEIIDKHVSKIMTPESIELSRKIIPDFWRAGYARDVPYQFIRKDGTIIDVMLDCAAVGDPQYGKISLTVVRDVTALRKAQEDLEARVLERTEALSQVNEDLRQQINERKRIEEALRESEERYRIIVENQTDLVVKVDTEGRFTFVSPSYCETFGKTESELLNHSFMPLVHEDDRPATEAAMKSLLQPPYTCYLEQRAMTKYGWRWLAWVDKAILNDNGEVETILGLGRDITERRRTEELLREERDRAQQYFDLALTIFIVLNRDGTIAKLNRKGLDLLKLSEEEVIGQNGLSLFVPEPYKTILIDSYMAVMENRASPVNPLEFPVRTGDAEERVILWHATALFDDAGGIIGMLASGEDITEQKRAQAEREATINLLSLINSASSSKEMLSEITTFLRELSECDSVGIRLRSDKTFPYSEFRGPDKCKLNGSFPCMNDTKNSADDSDPDSACLCCMIIAGKPDPRSPHLTERGSFCTNRLSSLPEPKKCRHKYILDQCDACGYESLALIPLRCGEDVLGLLQFSHKAPEHFTERRMALFERLADNIAIAVAQRQASETVLSYQEDLRSLASELSLTEERERRRIATDLHDHIGQNLAVSKIKLAQLRQDLPEQQAASTGAVLGLIEQAIKDVRSLIFDLSPPVLYELGFEAAVGWLADQMAEQHGIVCGFVTDSLPKPLDDDISVVLFKAVRELMINVVKHAQATNVCLSIRKCGGRIEVVISDDGKGFSRPALENCHADGGGYGLFSIRERLQHLDGQLTIESHEGKGTTVTLTAPIRNSGSSRSEEEPS